MEADSFLIPALQLCFKIDYPVFRIKWWIPPISALLSKTENKIVHANKIHVFIIAETSPKYNEIIQMLPET